MEWRPYDTLNRFRYANGGVGAGNEAFGNLLCEETCHDWRNIDWLGVGKDQKDNTMKWKLM